MCACRPVPSCREGAALESVQGIRYSSGIASIWSATPDDSVPPRMVIETATLALYRAVRGATTAGVNEVLKRSLKVGGIQQNPRRGCDQFASDAGGQSSDMPKTED